LPGLFLFFTYFLGFLLIKKGSVKIFNVFKWLFIISKCKMNAIKLEKSYYLFCFNIKMSIFDAQKTVKTKIAEYVWNCMCI
jgi:hypothetical protein